MKFIFLFAALVAGSKSYAVSDVAVKFLGKGVLLEKSLPLSASDCVSNMKVKKPIDILDYTYTASCAVKVDSDPTATALDGHSGVYTYPAGIAGRANEIDVTYKFDAEGYTLAVTSAAALSQQEFSDIVQHSIEELVNDKSNVVRVFRPDEK